MEKREIDTLFEQKKWEELKDSLEECIEEDYDEYSLIKLIQVYLITQDEKNAKKILRRMKRLHPSGEYTEMANEVEEAIEKGTVSEYIDKITVKKDSVSLAGLGERLGEKNIQRNSETVDVIQEYFKEIVGMTEAKKELESFYKRLKFIEQRKKHNFNVNLILDADFVIAGAGGSGKTMIAKLIARMLHEFSIRSKDKPYFIEAREIEMAYNANTSTGIEKLFNNANQATVIIENMENISENNFHPIAVILAKIMSQREEELSFIFTGTPEVIETIMKETNPLRGQIKNRIKISEYTTDELVEIAEKIAKKNAYILHESGKKALKRKLDRECKMSDFMNGITIQRLIEEAADKLAEELYNNENISEADMVYLKESHFGENSEDASLDSWLRQLDEMTGLHTVKEQVKKRVFTVMAERQAYEAGAERKSGSGSLHMVFTGNPGTGKTTVARIIGNIYQQLGILPRGDVIVECTRGDLVGKYQGHTADIVKTKVQDAIGGVLFIDEAYSLYRDEGDSFGKEAIDQLVPLIEEHKDEMLVVLAGYKKEMQGFMETNSGLSSRFRNYIEFDDYTVDEMTKIFMHMAKQKNMQIEDGAEETIHHMLEIKSKTKDFGNARGVRNKFEDVMEAMNERLARVKAEGAPLNKEDYDTITIEDIQRVSDSKEKGEKTLDELLEELNSMTGLQSAKAKVKEMIDSIQTQKYMKDMGMQTDGFGTLHLMFKGNAGTGKTTVANLISKIYTQLGVLKKNIVVEVNRSGLVAGYAGQTAIKVMKKLDEAEGGILFIDEAYSLRNSENDSFGKEAIDTLVAELDKRRENLMLIVAGYASDMDEFMRTNQGLKSRISNEIIFEDYSVEELMSIFMGMIKTKKYILADDVKEKVEQLLAIESQKEGFGNGRGVRNILERIEKRKNSRIAALIRNGEKLDKETILTIVAEDVQDKEGQ